MGRTLVTVKDWTRFESNESKHNGTKMNAGGIIDQTNVIGIINEPKEKNENSRIY